MKKSETLKIIQRLVAMYPSFRFAELPEELGGNINPVDFWHEQIGDMEFADAEKAVIECINTCKYVPTAMEIRDAYNSIVADRKKAEAAIITHYDQMRSTYGGDGEIREYLELFRERCGNTVEGADRLHKAMDAFVNSCTYTYTPFLDDAIRCIDIPTHTIPMEIMELMQENKRKNRLPEEVIRKHSKMGSSKPVDER